MKTLDRCMFCNKKLKNMEAVGVVGNKAICKSCSAELVDTVVHAFWNLWDKKFDLTLREGVKK